MKTLTLASILLSALSLVSGHGRIEYPKPLGYGSTPQLDGNAYNNPLAYDGSDFPCKGLIGKVDMTPQAKWTAGSKGYFKVKPNDDPNGGEGQLAAHSGGSCQASISFDNGKNWKVLQSYEGGCPRNSALNSNLAGPNQTFTFDVPAETKPGDHIFAWSWTARTGNRGEYYMNCASVTIEGSGTSTLDDYPDMYVGDMVFGDIKEGMCVSTAETFLEYPFPGKNCLRTTEEGQFKGPKGPGPDGKFTVCKAPSSTGPTYPDGGEEQPVPSSTKTPTEQAPTETPYPVPTDKAPTEAPYPVPTHEEAPPSENTPTPTPRPPKDYGFELTMDGYIYECRRVKPSY